MALSGSGSTNFVTKYYLQLEWNAVANSAKTSYTVSVNVYLVSGAAGYPIYSSVSKSGSITIDGTSYPFNFSAALSAGQKKLIGSASKSGVSPGKYITISASATLGITFNPGGYIGNVSVSSYGTLDTLDVAAPTISASVSDNATFGQLSIKWSSSAYCTSIQYSLDGGLSWKTTSYSGSSGTIVITGLYPGYTYNIVVCGYGSSSSKWGYYSIGSVTTMEIPEIVASSLPEQITFTRTSASTTAYMVTTDIEFRSVGVNDARTNVIGRTAYIYASDPSKSSNNDPISISSNSSYFTITLTDSFVKKNIYGDNLEFNMVVYYNNRTPDSADCDYYSASINVKIPIANYKTPDIISLYGIKDKSAGITTLYAICDMSSLIENNSNLSTNWYVNVYECNSGERSLITISSRYFTNLQNSVSPISKYNLIICEFSNSQTSTDDQLEIEFFDGYNIVVARCRIMEAANAKLAMGFSVPSKCVEFIEGLPILYYPGGYIGGKEFIEEDVEVSYPEIGTDSITLPGLQEY